MDCLVDGLANLCLQGFCLIGWEELLDVDQELWLNVICHCVVASEDLTVTVIDKARVGLDHVFLNHCCARHCVVENVKVFVDGFRGNFLAETLLESCVCKIHTDDNSTADVIPELLHSSVVHEVEVITLYEDTSGGDFVGHKLSLTHGESAKVAVLRVIHRDTTFHLDTSGSLHEFAFSRGLLKATKVVERGIYGLWILTFELLFK